MGKLEWALWLGRDGALRGKDRTAWSYIGLKGSALKVMGGSPTPPLPNPHLVRLEFNVSCRVIRKSKAEPMPTASGRRHSRGETRERQFISETDNDRIAHSNGLCAQPFH